MKRARDKTEDARQQVAAVRIVDPHVIRLITMEQRRTGEATSAGVAARLIIERLAAREREAAVMA